MQKLVSILLLFSLSLQCFSQLGVLISYEVNKDYIAQFLCINRDKPDMHCNGKCYLRKKLKQNEQHKQNGKELSGNKIEFSFFCNTSQQEEQVFFITDKKVFAPVIITGYCSPHISIFHPPREVSIS